MKRSAGKDQQLLLDTVLNNMSQGVLLFDSESRLVFCNQRYIEMYGLSPDLVQPGCKLSSLLDHRIGWDVFRQSENT
jgi:PAS domain-containing protein